MPNYLSPGVYVEEVEAGSRPDRGRRARPSPHSSASPRAGPTNAPTLVTNWSQFVDRLRRLHRGLVPRPRRVRLLPQRRRRGLRRAHRRRRRRCRRRRAEIATAEGRQAAGYRVTALEPGPAGNQITVEVTEADDAGRGHLQADGQRAAARHDEIYDNVSTKQGQEQRRHDGQGAVEADPDRGDRHGRRARARPGARQGQPRRRRRRAKPDRASRPTTTSATRPTAPASAASRRSTRSRCSPCPT